MEFRVPGVSEVKLSDSRKRIGSLERGGRPPSPVTVRYADGRTEVVPASAFEKSGKRKFGDKKGRYAARPCTVCGTSYAPGSPNSRYCSKECNKKAALQKALARTHCRTCGAALPADSPKEYCDASCYRRRRSVLDADGMTTPD